jgi:Arc/MetJ-type ribon-helix-helix transcriptional regulator
MKTLRISDGVHGKMTATVGTLMAQTGKMQTYEDVMEIVLSKSVVLPPEFLQQVEDFIRENEQLGYTTKEEFIRDAIRFRLAWLSEENKYIKISKEQCEQLEKAIREMGLSSTGVADFINRLIKDILEKYERWKPRTKKN